MLARPLPTSSTNARHSFQWVVSCSSSPPPPPPPPPPSCRTSELLSCPPPPSPLRSPLPGSGPTVIFNSDSQ
ncbi:hypothetical protein JOQ06_003375 [Pogonophryne albipinna]|uniref:Uncharacterized protein n=1 Tax=Pogonophryne albipinna TaxID=1090488 RepID=A0AAD6A611_9TELE|nr:hypothetical protein JOQ06_003375 [Pogonophryne albipinna]